MQADLVVKIRHEVLPIFGNVRMRLLESHVPTTPNISPPNTSVLNWFDQFTWHEGIAQTVEIITSTGADLELVPPIRRGVPLFAGGVFLPPVKVFLIPNNNQSRSVFALHEHDCKEGGCIRNITSSKLELRLPFFQQVCDRDRKECTFALKI